MLPPIVTTENLLYLFLYSKLWRKKKLVKLHIATYKKFMEMGYFQVAIYLRGGKFTIWLF